MTPPEQIGHIWQCIFEVSDGNIVNVFRQVLLNRSPSSFCTCLNGVPNITNYEYLCCEIFFYLFGGVVFNGFDNVFFTFKDVILLALITLKMLQKIYIVIARVFQALSHDYLTLFEFSANS